MKSLNPTFTLTKRVEWTMGHRIPGHTLDENIHGHRFSLSVTVLPLVVPQDKRFLDIKELATCLNNVIVSSFDHVFIFWEKDNIMKDFFEANKKLRHQAFPNIPTMENILLWIINKLKEHRFFKTRAKLIKATLEESPTSSTTFNASWGKEVEGN
ncbi:6-carboxytetrahydropterin synthase [Candidatus Gottesmanbacteria bacterium]|nr:6-carboxytetrahydropterin synthase [Candidatus Gottesmanbacteria bacterium]